MCARVCGGEYTVVGERVVVRATVIKIARAIIILKPAFLAAWSLDRSRRRWRKVLAVGKKEEEERVGTGRTRKGGGWRLGGTEEVERGRG